jgi:ribosome-associated protein
MADTYDRSAMQTRNNARDAAMALGAILKDHKAGNVMVLDVTGRNSWADYFIIVTVTSAAHSRGLQKHVYDSLGDLGLDIRPTRRKLPDGDEWALIDLGDIVVHLMTETARGFYDLEKLWFGAKDILAEK